MTEQCLASGDEAEKRLDTVSEGGEEGGGSKGASVGINRLTIVGFTSTLAPARSHQRGISGRPGEAAEACRDSYQYRRKRSCLERERQPFISSTSPFRFV